MSQGNLFDTPLPEHCTRPAPRFDGHTYDPERDQVRLSGQLLGVFNHTRYGGWWTLRDLAGAVSGSEAGVSARLRDLRKDRFGGHTVEARRRKGGLWEYRLEVSA